MLARRVVLAAAALLVWPALHLDAEERRFEGPGPVELHVHLTAKAEAQQGLEQAFREKFYPAIRSQKGFLHSNLLRIPDKPGEYVLTLAFQSEDLRLRWANSELHEKVWPEIQRHADPQKIKVHAFGIVPVKQ